MIMHYTFYISLIIGFFLTTTSSCLSQKENVYFHKYISIDDALKKADSVYVLELNNSGYSKKIPNEIFQFKNLIKLSFTGNDCDMRDDRCKNIDSLPVQICTLKKLSELSLVNNSLKKLPRCICTVTLRTLDLSDNPEINLDNILKINSLEVLNLNGCALIDIPDEINGLKKLKKLGLENNNIPIEKIKHLQDILPNCIISY